MFSLLTFLHLHFDINYYYYSTIVTQAGIKIAGRNINNLRHVGNTTLMAEIEELKSLLMKVKEEREKVEA